MNTTKVKEMIKDLIGKEVSLKVNVGRNKFEYYVGTIENIYPAIFTVKVDSLVKSFTYSDVLTKSVKIKINN